MKKNPKVEKYKKKKKFGTFETAFQDKQPHQKSSWFKKLDTYFSFKLRVIPRLFQNERLHLGVLGVGIMLLYGLSCSQEVLLEDDSLFVLTSYFYGVAHPPGYPLHTLLGKLFTWIPLGSIAYRVHLLSAVFGTLTCLTTYWITIKLTPKRVYGYIAAIALATSAVFWSQSIIAEVYTLNTFFFGILVALLIHVNETKSKQVLYVTAVVFGLSLTNHWPLIILSLPALLCLAIPIRKIIIRQIIPILGLIVVGVVPLYILLVIRSNMDPVISFYGPITSFRDFVFIFLRQGYGHIDKDPLSGSFDKLKYLGFYYYELFKMYTYIGLPLACVGIWTLIKSKRYIFLGALLWMVMGLSGMLVALLSFNYEYDFQQIFRVYPLISYGGVAILLSIGLSSSYTFLKQKFNQGWIEKGCLALTFVGLSICLVKNWEITNRSDYKWSKDYSLAILESLEPNTIFFLKGDFEMPIAAYHFLENVRPDISIYQPNGLVLNNRFWQGYPYKNNREQRNKLMEDFLAQTDRPIAYVTDVAHPYGKKFLGLYTKVDKDARPKSTSVVGADFLLKFFDKVTQTTYKSDTFTMIHKNLLYINASKVVSKIFFFSDSPNVKKDYLPYLNKLTKTFEGRLPIIKQAVAAHRQGKDVDLDQIWNISSIDYEQWDRPLKKRELASFYYFRGILAMLLKKEEVAIEEFRKSADINKLNKNPANKTILDIYYQKKDWENYYEVRQNILFRGKDASRSYEKMDKEMMELRRVMFNN